MDCNVLSPIWAQGVYLVRTGTARKSLTRTWFPAGCRKRYITLSPSQQSKHAMKDKGGINKLKDFSETTYCKCDRLGWGG